MTFYPEGGSDTVFYERYSGMELTEFVASPERIIGTVRRTGDAPVENVVLHVACFDMTGTLVAFIPGSPLRQNLPPDESTAFEAITLFADSPPCDFFLVTGFGY